MYRPLIALLWVAWAVYWLYPRASAKPVQRRESGWSRFAYWGLSAIGAILLFERRRQSGWTWGFFEPQAWRPMFHWLGVFLVCAGLAFAVWARVHLAGNWSGRVTIKEGHELIETGPYAWVRHPIYTGMILALLGTAIAFGHWRDLMGFALIAGSLLYKLRLEERWMAEVFPAAYPAYRQRTRALIPGIY